MLRAVLLACVAVVATAAPVQLNSHADPPLVRTKRSEEAILFGNHQNFARMKKGDPHPKPFNSLSEPEDAAVNPSDDSEQKQPEPSPNNDEQLDESTQPEGAAQMAGKNSQQLDEEEQIERLLTPDAEVDPLTASADKAEEERILEQLMEDKKHPGAAHSSVPSEGLPIAHPDKVLEEEDPTLEEEEEEEEVASGEADNSNLQENDEYKDYIQQPYYYENNKNARDYEADKLLFPPSLLKSYREKRSLVKSRGSRSLPDAATAEDMMSGGPSPQVGAISKKLTGRVKRGLPISPAELEEILEREYYGDESVPTEEEYYGDDEFNEIPDDEPTVERRAYDEWVGYEDGPVLDIDPRSEDAMYLPPEDTEAVAENEINPEERMQMLEYLYNTNQGPSYGGEEGDEGPGYPGDFEESWHDLGPAKETMQYEPEPYYGGENEEEEQDFDMAPSKRQYLSLVPGNKRGGDFYPYQYGPDSRWGAMVPDPDREKRNEMAEYERLYELAQALNGPDESEGGSYDKRFDYGEPSYYQGYDRRRK